MQYEICYDRQFIQDHEPEIQMTFLVLLKESQNRYMVSSMIVNNHRESGIKYELLINRNTCIAIGVNISERKSGTKRTKNRTARNKNKKALFSMFCHHQRAQLVLQHITS